MFLFFRTLTPSDAISYNKVYPPGPVDLVDGVSISDVIPIRKLPSCQFVWDLPHVFVVQLHPPMCSTVQPSAAAEAMARTLKLPARCSTFWQMVHSSGHDLLEIAFALVCLRL